MIAKSSEFGFGLSAGPSYHSDLAPRLFLSFYRPRGNAYCKEILKKKAANYNFFSTKIVL